MISNLQTLQHGAGESNEMLSSAGATKIKIDTKTIAKNKDSHLYLIDLKQSCKYNGRTQSNTSFVIVYSASDGTQLLQKIEYTKENKSDKKEVAISRVSRG